jgi:hypothetical protein
MQNQTVKKSAPESSTPQDNLLVPANNPKPTEIIVIAKRRTGMSWVVKDLDVKQIVR